VEQQSALECQYLRIGSFLRTEVGDIWHTVDVLALWAEAVVKEIEGKETSNDHDQH